MMKGSFYKKSKFRYARNSMRKTKFYTDHQCLNSKVFYPDIPIFFQIGIFDPGVTSCGLRIVRYNLMTKEMAVIWFSVINFGNVSSEINQNMDNSFSKIIMYLEDCHHIVVEHQLMKSEITYQCFSSMIYYLTNNVCIRKMRPMLIEVDCQLKTSYLGGPRTKRENGGVEIKEWSKQKAREFSIERNDLITYHILENSLYKQNEDLSDTVCYEYSWISYIMSRNDIYLPFEKELFNI